MKIMDELKALLKRLSETEQKKEEEKIVTQITGSLEAEKPAIKKADPITYEELKPKSASDDDAANAIMEKILNLDWFDKALKKSVAPIYSLKSNKPKVWLYSSSRMNFFPVDAKAEVIVVDMKNPTTINCVIGNDMYEVNVDMIQEIGWNW